MLSSMRIFNSSTRRGKRVNSKQVFELLPRLEKQLELLKTILKHSAWL